jgi:hypothetical protein
MGLVALGQTVFERPVPAPEPEILDSRWLLIEQALLDLGNAISAAPAPAVDPPAVNLDSVVEALTALRGTAGPTAEEIANAISTAMPPAPIPVDPTDALRLMIESLAQVENRLRGLGNQAFGGGSVTLQPGQTVAISNPTRDPETGLAKDATLTGLLPRLVGTWGYRAGISGRVLVTGRVIGVTAHCTTAGSMTINGGDSVPIPALVGYVMTPQAQLVSPTFVFTGTDSYFVEVLT